jgi:hypothetical protein
MGKPIKKINFGDPSSPTATGKEIQMQADLGNGEVTAWVIEQTSTSEYKLTDGTDILDCELKPEVQEVGDAVLLCYPFTGGSETVRVLTQHRMKTFEFSNYDWVENTEANGQAQLTSDAPTVPFTAVITSVDGLAQVGIAPNGDSAFSRWIADTTTFAEIGVSASGGSGNYVYTWFLEYGRSARQEFGGETSSDPTFTQAEIESLLGTGLSDDEEDFKIICRVDDGDDDIELPVNVRYENDEEGGG